MEEASMQDIKSCMEGKITQKYHKQSCFQWSHEMHKWFKQMKQYLNHQRSVEDLGFSFKTKGMKVVIRSVIYLVMCHQTDCLKKTLKRPVLCIVTIRLIQAVIVSRQLLVIIIKHICVRTRDRYWVCNSLLACGFMRSESGQNQEDRAGLNPLLCALLSFHLARLQFYFRFMWGFWTKIMSIHIFLSYSNKQCRGS